MDTKQTKKKQYKYLVTPQQPSKDFKRYKKPHKRTRYAQRNISETQTSSHLVTFRTFTIKIQDVTNRVHKTINRRNGDRIRRKKYKIRNKSENKIRKRSIQIKRFWVVVNCHPGLYMKNSRVSLRIPSLQETWIYCSSLTGILLKNLPKNINNNIVIGIKLTLKSNTQAEVL